jgi:hypothetical protein
MARTSHMAMTSDCTSASCSDASDSARLLLAREMRGLLPCTLRMDASLPVLLPPWCRPSCMSTPASPMHDTKLQFLCQVSVL